MVSVAIDRTEKKKISSPALYAQKKRKIKKITNTHPKGTAENREAARKAPGWAPGAGSALGLGFPPGQAKGRAPGGAGGSSTPRKRVGGPGAAAPQGGEVFSSWGRGRNPDLIFNRREVYWPLSDAQIRSKQKKPAGGARLLIRGAGRCGAVRDAGSRVRGAGSQRAALRQQRKLPVINVLKTYI